MQCLKFLANYALTQQHFVAGTKREQQAAMFKRDGRPIELQEEFKTRGVWRKLPYFSGQIGFTLS